MLRGSAALAALAMAQTPLSLFGLEEPVVDDAVVPFLDVQPKGKMLYWQDLSTWITPNDQLYSVSHYGNPAVDLDQWRLEISGLVKKPRTLTVADVKARKRRTVTATLECSGNSASEWKGAAESRGRFLRWSPPPPALSSASKTSH